MIRHNRTNYRGIIQIDTTCVVHKLTILNAAIGCLETIATRINKRAVGDCSGVEQLRATGTVIRIFPVITQIFDISSPDGKAIDAIRLVFGKFRRLIEHQRHRVAIQDGTVGKRTLREIVSWRFVADKATVNIHLRLDDKVAYVGTLFHPDGGGRFQTGGVIHSILQHGCCVTPRGAVLRTRAFRGHIYNIVFLLRMERIGNFVCRFVAADVNGALLHAGVTGKIHIYS